MNTPVFAALAACIACLLGSFASYAQSAGPWVPPDFYNEPESTTRLYIENKGQVHDLAGAARPDIHFYTENTLPNLYLAERAISFVYHQRDTAELDSVFRIDMHFVPPAKGSGGVATPSGHKQAGHHYNYYGRTASGVEQVHGFGRVVYEQLYTGIDLHAYANSLAPKFAVVVHPGGNVADAVFQFSGHDQLTIHPHYLKLYAGSRTVQLPQAVAYQVDAANNVLPVPWQPTFVNLGNQQIGLQAGPYNPNHKLVFQIGLPDAPTPTAPANTPSWNTSFGGTGHDAAYSMVADANGNLYVVGETTSSSVSFPESQGSAQTELGGSTDGFAAMFDVQYKLLWCTYLGGTQPDYAFDVAHEPTGVGATYVCGATDSEDFPVDPENLATYQQTAHLGSSFITKLNELGQIIWSTAFALGDISAATGVDYDQNGNVYLAGYGILPTESYTCTAPTNGGFALCNPGNGAYVLGNNGSNFATPLEGYLARFTPDGALTWSTMLAGSGNDVIQDVAVDRISGTVAVTGYTNSLNTTGSTCGLPTNGQFPLCGVGLNWLQPYLNSDSLPGNATDAFVTEFTLAGQLRWSSYFGGEENEQATTLGYSSQGELYIGGFTQTYGTSYSCLPNNGLGFTLCADATEWSQPYNNPTTNDEVFLARFTKERELEWSSYVGGSAPESYALLSQHVEFSPYPALVLTAADEVVLGTGTGGKHAGAGSDFPWQAQAFTYYGQAANADFPSPTQQPVPDGGLLLLNNQNQLQYATYMGGAGTSTSGLGDAITAVAVYDDGDGTQRIYAAGSTYSTEDFPYNCPAGLPDPWCEQGMGTINAQSADAFVVDVSYYQAPPSAVEETTAGQALLLAYPNPVAHTLTVQATEPGLLLHTATVFNALGQAVLQPAPARQQARSWQLDVAQLPPGLYIAQLATNRGTRSVRVVKQ